MNFDIKMNTTSVFNGEEGNYLLVLDEETVLDNGETIQEIWEEFHINTIVDAIELIKEINEFDSINEFYASLEIIDNKIEDT